LANFFDKFDTQPKKNNFFDKFDKPAAPQEQPQVQAEQSSTAMDIAKSAGVGLVKGGINTLGLLGDAENLLVHGYDKLTGNERQQSYLPGFPTSDFLQKKLESYTGPLYEPQTTAGEYADTIASFAPGLLTGGTSGLVGAGVKGAAKELAKRAVADVALPGAASESLGQATEGTALEPFARLSGALVGGGAGAFARRTKAPDIKAQMFDDLKAKSADIKQAAKAAYQKADNAGITVKPDSMQTAFGAIRNKIIDDTGLGTNNKIFAANFPNINSKLNALDDVAKGPVTLKGLDNIRQTLRDLPKNASDKEIRYSKMLVDGLDDYISNLSPMDIASAKGPSQEAVDALLDARKLYRDSSVLADKTKIVDDLVERARDRLQANYTEAGHQTAIRQEFKALKNKFRNDPDIAKLFSPDEKQAIDDLVRGTPKENAYRKLGKMGPPSIAGTFYRGMVPGIGAGTMASLMFGPAAPVIGGGLGFGAAVTGHVARRAAEGMQQSNLDKLLQAMLNNGQAVPQAVTRSPARSKLLDALLATSNATQGLRNP
jgi:hypothetical protein